MDTTNDESKMDTTRGLRFGLCDTDDGERIALFGDVPFVMSKGKFCEAKSSGVCLSDGKHVFIFDGNVHPWRTYPRKEYSVEDQEDREWYSAWSW
jgi:hypothetical protein